MFLKIYNLFRMEMISGTILGYFLQAVPITIVVGILYAVCRLVFLKHRNCHIVWLSETMRLLFVCYLTGLCSLVILPLGFWVDVFDGIFFGWWEEMGPFFRLGEISLIPTIVRCLSGEYSLGSWVKEMIVGNVVMFIPFGFFLPFVTKKLNRTNIFVIAAAVPIIVELFQLILGRSFDIDDLICNFLGIIIGFFIAVGIKAVGRTASKSKKEFKHILRMLDVLLSNETSEAEKRKILQADYDIQMTQTMEREVSVMCNLSKGVREKGVAEGMTNGILFSIKNLMETLGLTIEQAMAALKIPDTEKQKYMDLLERQ